MAASAICVDRLGKRYRIGERQRYYTLRDAIARRVAKPFKRLGASSDVDMWALRDVSFEIPAGQVVGIIGRNGAGKTTLLRLLSRITEPTEGRGEINGRIASLLEIGTGFHPELTGRENVYLNGAILGMKKAEIAQKFDEIVAFAEIEPFIDTPVKRYSSGMYMRLAFAVAAHLDTEILLIDEVLAVGDIAFQKKCLGKIGGIASDGRTVLFVSHNLGAVLTLCERAIWLDHGVVAADGPAAYVTRQYQSTSQTSAVEWQRPAGASALHGFRFVTVRVADADDRASALFDGNQPICVTVDYAVERPLQECQIIADIENGQGIAVLITGDTDALCTIGSPRRPGQFRTVFRLPGCLLTPGHYSVSLSADVLGHAVLDQVRQAVSFEVTTLGSTDPMSRRKAGIISPLVEWETASMDVV
jgi:lipopolysaccharide transport system ATP-binding protein